MHEIPERYRFFINNLLKGLLWFSALVVLFVLFQKHGPGEQFREFLQPLYDRPFFMYLIYSLSEIFFGIIPPELFMIWGLSYQSALIYIEIVALLAAISYAAGVLGFYFGRFLNTTVLFRYARKRYFMQYQQYLLKYGFFLIFVAALTPIPFSAICMLVGASKYPARRFFLFSLSRFIRFGFYSFIIWQSNGAM